MKDAVIVFEKEPVPGLVKTRLAKDIGQENAVKVYSNLLSITHSVLQNFKASIFVYRDGNIPEKDDQRKNYHYRIQDGKDLGERMSKAFEEVLQGKNEKVLLIGTDCPEISQEILMMAFSALEKNDVVLGPAFDGGYYLIGMKKKHPMLFDQIKWSTNVVLQKTIEKITHEKLSYYLLPTLRDLDNLEDLRYFQDRLIIKS